MGCVSGFLQVEDGEDVGGEVRENGFGGGGVLVHAAKGGTAEGHVFGDLRGDGPARLAVWMVLFPKNDEETGSGP